MAQDCNAEPTTWCSAAARMEVLPYRRGPIANAARLQGQCKTALHLPTPSFRARSGSPPHRTRATARSPCAAVSLGNSFAMELHVLRFGPSESAENEHQSPSSEKNNRSELVWHQLG
jgi:hypothetical protein